MDPILEARAQTQRFIDGVQAAPGKLIRARVEQNQTELIRARMQKQAIDDRIAYLESSVEVLQGEVPARPGRTKWPIFAAVGVGIGAIAATVPLMLLWLGLMYLVVAMLFGAVALPVLIARGAK